MTWKMKAIIAAVAGAAVFGVAWQIQDWRYGAEIAGINERHASEKQAISDEATRAAQANQRRLEKAQQDLADLDNLRWKELQDANAEIARLRTGIADGTLGLRVNAVCPAGGGASPEAPAASGVGNAAAPRLTDTAERDYLALRERIEQAGAMIRYLQGYALSCSSATTSD